MQHPGLHIEKVDLIWLHCRCLAWLAYSSTETRGGQSSVS
jgi:hypothetical protein